MKKKPLNIRLSPSFVSNVAKNACWAYGLKIYGILVILGVIGEATGIFSDDDDWLSK